MIKEFFYFIFLSAVVYSHYTMYVQADVVTADGVDVRQSLGIYAQYLNIEPGDMKGQSSDEA